MRKARPPVSAATASVRSRFLPTTASQAQDFRVQTYRGTKILTWFESSGGVYGGSWVLYDGGYQEVARVHAGHGYQGDLHEFLIVGQFAERCRDSNFFSHVRVVSMISVFSHQKLRAGW